MTDVRPVDDGFAFDCADGTGGVAAKVLLASGIVDELPEIAGSSLSTVFRSITVCTATASNMPANPWPRSARGIRGRSLLS